MDNPNRPASPAPWWPVGEGDGLTKREYFAGLAMQGILAAEAENFTGTPEQGAKYAVQIADALLKELGREQSE